MSFMLGPFLGGLASGAKTGMDLYTQYQEISAKQAAAQGIDDAKNTEKAANANSDLNNTLTQASAGANPNDGTAAPLTDSNGGGADPGGPEHSAKAKDSTLTNVLSAASAFGKAKSDASQKGTYDATTSVGGSTANPVVGADGQGKQGVSTAPVNMTTYDTQSGQPGALNGPSPSSAGQQRGSGPDMSHITNTPVGSTVGNWLHGRTSAPTYLPKQNSVPGQALPTSTTGSPVARGAGALATGGSAANTPTLANQQSTLGQSLLNSLSGNNTVDTNYTAAGAM